MKRKRSARRNPGTKVKRGLETRPQRKRAIDTEPAVEVSGAVVGRKDATSEAGVIGIPPPETTIGPADTVGDGNVLVEIDPGLTGRFVHDRFDIMVRGRAISDAPIVEVRLESEDLVASVASFGQPERAAAATLPDGTPARQRGFQFNLPCERVGTGRECSFAVIALTDQEIEHRAEFRIDIDPASAESVKVLEGSAHNSVAASMARPHALLYIERATIEGETLTVDGWTVAMGPILGVQIFADDERVGNARVGIVRDDVAAAHSIYPNGRLSGFTSTIALDEVDRDVRVVRAQVVCLHGFGHTEAVPVERVAHRAASPVVAPIVEERQAVTDPDPSGEIHLFCDEAHLTGAGHLSLQGWAVCACGIAQVRVLVDDTEVGLATYGFSRPDVGSNYRGIPESNLSGFKFDAGVGGWSQGEHVVRVVVRNMRGEVNEATVAIEVGDGHVVDTGLAVPRNVPPALTEEQQAEFKFELDAPMIANGVAVEIVTGRLTIDGWLLSRSGVDSFDVFLDDQRLGEMHYGLARQDVGTAFPEWPNSLRSGYAFHCPPRSLRDGDHTIRLVVKAKSGVEIERSFRILVKKADDQQDNTALRRRMPRVEIDMIAALLSDLNYAPDLRFVLRQGPVVSADALRITLNSLRLQSYDRWSVLVLADSQTAADAVRAIVEDIVPFLATRFLIVTASDVVWTQPLADAADGRDVLVGLLLPGDEIGADALWELVMAMGREPFTGLVYGDELRISPVSLENEAFFKPDFSPDLLYSTNYIGRPWLATASVIAQTGVTLATLWEDGEYDLVLRAIEGAGYVSHVPKLLCQRSAEAQDSPERECRALERMLQRREIAAAVLETPIPGTWRLKRELQSGGKVSIIIPTCAAHGHIETCLTTLRARTAYKNYEIIVVDNIPASETKWKTWVRENADKVLDEPNTFNWSIFNNRAAAISDGDYLLFLNDDIEIVQDDWLDAMLEHAQRPEVGITGPQLLYSDGKVQHAGMFLANNGIGRHAFRFAANDDPCYFGLALTQRNVIAVTGACMLMRRDIFDKLGGFEEAHQIVNNDLDFSLRIHQAGLLTVYTPYASLIHYELASRAYLKDVFDLTHFDAAWKTVFAAGDPYFNPRLSKHANDYRPDDEPVQWVVSGSPIFHKEEIKRILVVKLDHIGDFVTALQPIRRFKSIFPEARITVLAGRASRAFVALERSIDEFIAFDFFHARSQLGEREITKEDFEALAEQLRPYQFDLAVDLRKHPSTRDVLKYTSARFLAGFDHLGQYPYLDIAVNWDGDQTLQRKRSHIVDDLQSLVTAIERATETDRVIMRPGPTAMPIDEMPEQARGLFTKPVVAVHPGAGNITKQWPEEHFSALIDLLIERNDVNILLIGGPDEVEVAEGLAENVLRPDRVASVAGQTSLADLPRILKNCVLYIGNDSGPKHIAAAIGLPTIGIHSGVVDPVEWGPLGPMAVALRRNMTCSPCYLANADDCPRSLACLRFLEPSIVYETANLMLMRVRLASHPLPHLGEDHAMTTEANATPTEVS